MRKRCPKCGAFFEGDGVDTTYSCDICGNGHLTTLPMVSENDGEGQLPRSGGGQNITHARDNF